MILFHAENFETDVTSRPVEWCVSEVGGGSLGSSVSHGLSSAALSTRRPGSLVIGAAQMSKSSSEPMNLITDTVVVSPNTGQPVDVYCSVMVVIDRDQPNSRFHGRDIFREIGLLL